MASGHLASRSLLKNPTQASKDCSLTMDLYQNFGFFPTSHSVLLTRTTDFKSSESRYWKISSKISGGHLVTNGELVFWASQHFSHRKLDDESFHFLKDIWSNQSTLQGIGDLSCAPSKTCRNKKSFWDPSTYHPNTTGVGWIFLFQKSMFWWDTLVYMYICIYV